MTAGSGIFSTPRPIPSRIAPALAAGGLIVLALPVFVVAGWPLRGWLLAAVLWTGALAFSLLLSRLPRDPANVAAASMRGIGTSSRALLVGIPLVAVTVANQSVGVSAAILYALAFTVELVVGLVSYFGSEAAR
jgi:uncharacterized membrane protein YiaA